MRLTLPALALLSCAPSAMDTYWLSYSLEPAFTARPWRAALLPPRGYNQYPDLTMTPYREFYTDAVAKLAAVPNLTLLTDTTRTRAAVDSLVGSWDVEADASTFRALGRALGVDAVVVVDVESVVFGYIHNDRSQPKYYEVVLVTKVFDVAGGMLYNARSRGKEIEDLAGSLKSAVEKAVKPLREGE